MYTPINTIREITNEIQAKLHREGIKYVEQLLVRGRTDAQRRDLAQRTLLSLVAIENLVNCADLMRLRGVGGDLSYMLQKAGVTNCRHLQTCNAECLYKQLAALHIGQKIGYHAPTQPQVRSWINEAKLLAGDSPQ